MTLFIERIIYVASTTSYFLCPQLISLLNAAKTVSQQKKGQNSTRIISKFALSTALWSFATDLDRLIILC